MNAFQLAIMGVFLFAISVLYWYLLFELVGNLLEGSKLKKVLRIPIGILNTAIVFYLCPIIGETAPLCFLIFSLMIIEFMAFYKDKFVRVLFCASACIIHVLVIMTIMISAFSLAMGYSTYEILTQEFWLIATSIATLITLNLAVIGVLKFIPLAQVKIINQHKDQQWFLIVWMIVNIMYLLFSSTYNMALSANQIASSLAILIGLYIVLFFAIKTSMLLGYKEKNAELEQVVHHEQQYRNSIIKDAILSYEFNITEDLIIKGFEDKEKEFGMAKLRYSDVALYMATHVIYSEDVEEFTRYTMRSNMLRAYEIGKSEMTMEYRRLMASNEYIWVRAITNLVKDNRTGDIRGFTYVKDINEEKQNQIELQYKAERDPLTGLYNKVMTGKLVDEHLFFGKSDQKSALFMIDVDNFKMINDQSGHIYGDAVLCELADKLRHIFRSEDIIGRIGGDEYIAFLKDGATVGLVKTKAEEICKTFHITYKNQNNGEQKFSGSVGISFYPQDGQNFEELYNHADIALYDAKNKGKNTYAIYDGSEFSGYKSNQTEIQPIGNIPQKGFRQNRIEYVFKMLYQSENPVIAIHSALELVASHFSFERGYIFETSKDGKTTSNTFEWCAEGITPEINMLQNVPIEAVETANSHFYKNGTFVLKSLDDLQPIERAVLEPQGIKSMFQFGIFDKMHLLGFIGFDNCISESIPSDNDIDEMATICNILATFFVKQHIDEVAENDLRSRQEVMNHLDNYIYVINMETFEVIFMNENIQNLIKDTNYNEPCYSFFRGNKKQCEDCPILRLGKKDADKTVSEIYNEKLDIWLKTTASTLRWTDGTIACLINCVDITKQREEHLNHINQLEKLAYVDELTGSRTYYKFKVDAKRILENNRDISHLLTKFDISNFKLINQIYGYEKGDEILRCVAKALEQTTRNENEIFARIGNDEFIVLFDLQDNVADASIYNNFTHHFYDLVGSDFTFKCNFPHGRYIIPHGNMQEIDINDMFEKANIAHKVAKQDKTLSFAIYDEKMTREALYAKEIENKMSAALRNNEFAVYLQPKYNLATESIVGAEALVRWENENTDLFLPSAFISIFEKNGFLTKLDFYMLYKTCDIIKGWIKAGKKVIPISVNFSKLHLNNTNFVKELCEITDRAGIDRKYIEIEITETIIYENIDTFGILLANLHEAGFTMSMDDFGSGYSSLGMLKDLPVDVIKIDRSFFVNQKDEARSKIVLGSIIKMAASLGICIVAEGVEEQKHIDFLRELQCDVVQGYYYAKPMPAEKFTELIS